MKVFISSSKCKYLRNAKTWSTIIKNKDRNNDNQTMNFITAIQHGKAIVSEVTPSELLQIDIEDV